MTNVNIYEVDCYNLQLDRLCAVSGKKIYFVSQNILYSIIIDECMHFYSLESSVKSDVPDGHIVSLMRFGNGIILGCKIEDLISFYYKGNNSSIFIKYHTINAEQIGRYFVDRDNNFIIYYEYTDNVNKPSRIFIVDKNLNVRTIVCPIRCDHIHCLCVFENKLYVAVGDCISEACDVSCVAHHVILSTDFNSSLPDYGITNLWSIVSAHLKCPGVIGFIKQDNRLVLCTDGYTSIFDLNGQKVWRADNENGVLGFQIGASVNYTLNKSNLTILGSWRRSKEYPAACLHLLVNNEEKFRLCDNLNLGAQHPWTGYNDYDCSFDKPDNVFWVNEFSPTSLLINKSEASPVKNSQDSNTIYADNNFAVTYKP